MSDLSDMNTPIVEHASPQPQENQIGDLLRNIGGLSGSTFSPKLCPVFMHRLSQTGVMHMESGFGIPVDLGAEETRLEIARLRDELKNISVVAGNCARSQSVDPADWRADIEDLAARIQRFLAA